MAFNLRSRRFVRATTATNFANPHTEDPRVPSLGPKEGANARHPGRAMNHGHVVLLLLLFFLGLSAGCDFSGVGVEAKKKRKKDQRQAEANPSHPKPPHLPRKRKRKRKKEGPVRSNSEKPTYLFLSHALTNRVVPASLSHTCCTLRFHTERNARETLAPHSRFSLDSRQAAMASSLSFSKRHTHLQRLKGKSGQQGERERKRRMGSCASSIDPMIDGGPYQRAAARRLSWDLSRSSAVLAAPARSRPLRHANRCHRCLKATRSLSMSRRRAVCGGGVLLLLLYVFGWSIRIHTIIVSVKGGCE